MKHLRLIGIMILSLMTFASTWADDIPYHQQRREIFRQLPVQSGDIVFVGNSITDFGLWPEFFDNVKVLNRGIQGLVSQEVVDNIALYASGHPSKIFLMIGINDYQNTSVVAPNIKKIIQTIKRESPTTTIYVQSVLPCNLNPRQTTPATLNPDIQQVCQEEGVEYIDIYSQMKNTDGSMPSGYTYDSLHPNAEGYRFWCKIIQDKVGTSSTLRDEVTPTAPSSGLINAFKVAMAEFEMLPAATTGDMLHVGDYLVDVAEWGELMGTNKFKNRGMGFGTANNSLYLSGFNNNYQRIIKGSPSKIFFQCGRHDIDQNGSSTNLVSMQTAYRTALNNMKSAAPGATIYLESLVPSADASLNTSYVVPFNTFIQNLVTEQANDKVKFVDVYSALVDETTGALAEKYQGANTNQSHGINGRAYVVWANVLKNYVDGSTVPTIMTDAQNALNEVYWEALNYAWNHPEETSSENSELRTLLAEAESLITSTSNVDAQCANKKTAIFTALRAAQQLRIKLTTDDVAYCYTLKDSRKNHYVGLEGTNVKCLASVSDRAQEWVFTENKTTGYNIQNAKTLQYIVPGTGSGSACMTVSSDEPSTGWTLNAVGDYFTVVSGTNQMNAQNTSNTGNLFNWGDGSNTIDGGCLFTIALAETVEGGIEPVLPEKRTTLFSTLNGGMDIPPYRIPGITCGKDGRLIASAARLVCGTDPGFGQVDCVVKISDDNGKTWSSKEIDVAVGDASLINNTKTPMEAAYGDPAVVMDKEHNEVLVMAVGGCTVYTNPTTTRQNPNIIACIRSLDGGQTWQTPVEQTEHIYGLFDNGNPMAAAFVGGGKLFQSRIVKVGEYYRLYAALAARPNGNRVVYSDDFGRTWKVLGVVTDKPVPNGDEPKCEELPDGRVIITSRTDSGRLMNIYTYSNTRTGAGKWETETKATMSGLSANPSANPTNGEMLIVPVKRKADNKYMYVALQSVPTGSGRNNVGIFYKELADASDIRDLSAFTSGWDGFYQVSSTASAYSSIELQADDKIAFFYEETLTKWGTKSNPVSTSFPTGSGTHNFDGFENIYVPLALETITDGRYVVSHDVNRGSYLKDFFNSVVDGSNLSISQKTTIKAEVAKLQSEPTIDEIDAIYALLSSIQPEDPWDGKKFTITNIQKSGTKYPIYVNDSNILSIGTNGQDYGTKAQFVAESHNGKVAFKNVATNQYMIWRAGNNYGYNNNAGTLSTYNSTYCDWAINASNNSTGNYWLCSTRSDGTTAGSLIILSTGVFDSWGNSEGWSNTYSNVYIISEVLAPADDVTALQNKIDDIVPSIEADKIGAPRQANSDVQALLALKTVTAQNYEAALSAYNKVLTVSDVNLPVSGKAYKIAVRKSDGTTKWYIKGTGFTTTATEADIFVCGKAASGEFPYVFVTNDNKFLTSRGVNTTEAYTAKVNDFKAEAMVGHSSTFINSAYPTFGTICLTAQGRNGNLNSNGTIIVREATSQYDNSSAPYLNGQFTSALIVEEASYPYNNVELKKAGTSDTEAYATVYLPFDMQVPAGIEVYKATEERDVNNKTYLKLARVNTENGPVAKGAYVLYSESTAGKNVIVPTATKLTAGTDNLLIGSTAQSAQRSALKNPYVLAYKGTPVAVGFYRYTADVYPLGKAIYDDSASQANCFNFDFDNIVEAISTLRSEGTDSILIDLSGRRVNNNTKGIVIKNNRKAVIK